LYLLVTTAGSKLWRLDYRFAGKRKTLALGSATLLGLAEARRARDAAKLQIAEGEDPGAVRRQRKAAARVSADNTFKAIADAYMEKREREHVGPAALRKDREALAHAFAGFGAYPIEDVRPTDVLSVCRKIERREKAAQRFRATVSRVFRFAIASGLADTDPAAHLADALVKRPVKHHASPKEPRAIGALVRAVAGYEGEVVTRTAMLLGIYTFARPGEVRTAEWKEFDLSGAIWRIPASKMKMKRDHLVPLSKQVVALLEDLRGVTGGGKLLFPSVLGGERSMSDYTVNSALRRLGYSKDEVVGHGFRSMASTTLNESGQFDRDWIERQLAHVDAHKIRGIYNAAEYLPRRIEMMQWYADWLDARATTGTTLTSSRSLAKSRWRSRTPRCCGSRICPARRTCRPRITTPCDARSTNCWRPFRRASRRWWLTATRRASSLRSRPTSSRVV